MSRKNNRFVTTDLDHARDELFAHVHRCGVLQATGDQQVEWLDDTTDYLGERYPNLSREELDELKSIGVRFCQPVIPHGKGNTAITAEDAEEELPACEVPEPPASEIAEPSTAEVAAA